MNIRAVQEVMNAQTLEYSFPFSKFSFSTDIVTIVLCDGRKSAFFQVIQISAFIIIPSHLLTPLPRQTGFTVPLETKPLLKDNLYKPRDQIKIPDTVKLAAYRSFLAAAKCCFGTVQVAEETSRVCAISDTVSYMTNFQAAHSRRLCTSAPRRPIYNSGRSYSLDEGGKVRNSSLMSV